MTERKDLTDDQKSAAWINSGGSTDYNNNPSGTANCPRCKSPMKANDYGIDSEDSWVVDHKEPLAKGGTNSDDNLQAMCRHCNSVKSDN